ncbi:MAG: response regulator [Baekduiaceae bacterium]
MGTDAYSTILAVEDNDEDFVALVRAFRSVAPDVRVDRCIDGDEALDYLHRRGEYAEVGTPGLVVLDLNLPGTDGREVLEVIKADEGLRMLPVIVLSTSGSADDVHGSYRGGANCYVQKALDPTEFRRRILALRSFWMEAVLLPSASTAE